MKQSLYRRRSFVIRILVVMLSGLTALVWPGATLTMLRWMFSICALADGIAIVSQPARRDLEDGWRWP